MAVAQKRIGRVSLNNEPNWVTGDVGSLPAETSRKRPQVAMTQKAAKESKNKRSEEEEGPIQQSDLLKPLMMDIAKKGLNFAFQKWIKRLENPQKRTKTQKPKKVIVVGAGMAGLVAAYELQQVGHDVILLESQMRVGGRIHSLAGEKYGFEKEPCAEGRPLI